MAEWDVDALIDYTQELFRDIKLNTNGDESVKESIHLVLSNKTKR